MSPLRSTDGYVLMATHLPHHSQEEDVYDLFTQFGYIKQFSFRRCLSSILPETSYCLVQFETKEEAADAITNLDGYTIASHKISVDWAFSS
ncbi:hypothetical protein P9112_003216 [Eukaryota sp. TZLM1-RC]